MAELYPELVFRDDQELYAEPLNRAFGSLDVRIRLLEALKISWEDAIGVLQQYGLERLDNALLPVYESLVSISRVGILFSAGSSTPNLIGMGTKTFVLDEIDRLRFAVPQYMTVNSKSTPADGMLCLFSSYNEETGVLIVSVLLTSGSLVSHDDWLIAMSSPPFLDISSIDAGTY